LSEALALGKKLTNVIVAEGQAVTCNDDKTEKTFNEPSRPTTRMESIVIAAKTILGTNLGPSPFSYDERTSTVIGSKYEAIKVLANLLRGQEITVNDFGAAQLLVLRLTIDEALNIINTGTSPAEFDPNNLQSLEFVKIDLETGLKQVVFAQHFKWVKNMAAKGYGINTEKPEGMLDYSEEIFLEAGNDNTELFCTVFGSLEELKQAVTRDIERFK